MVFNSRFAALKILNDYQLQKTNLSHLLNNRLNKYECSKDSGFIRELVWGVVRHLNTIDWLIDTFSTRSSKIEISIRNILRLGIYQILFCGEKVPDYAAVNESVNLTAAVNRKYLSGYVNAVLRQIMRKKDDIVWPEEIIKNIALKYSYPEWLVSRWVNNLGQNEAIELCMANNIVPLLTIRANTIKISREELKIQLEKEGVKTNYCKYSPDGLVLSSKPELEKLESYKAGLFLVQDEASQLVSYILKPKDTDFVLDLCAGAGIKTSHLAQIGGRKASITSIDNSLRQINKAAENFKRLGIENINSINENICSVENISADCILLDAPCSGLGVIRRKPDIKWNRKPEDINSYYPDIQKKMLMHASKLLKAGGRLVYSVCTAEPEENENVVNDFLSSSKNFILEEIQLPFLGDELLTSNKFFFKSYVHKHGMDGFFAAQLKRVK